MEKEITFLIGMPGSGKSYLLNKITEYKKSKNEENFAILDDISQTDPALKELKKYLLDNVTKHIYISDVNFLEINVIEVAQEKIEKILNKEIEVKKIIFIADKQTCINNVAFRNDGRNVDGTISRFGNNISTIKKKYENDNNTDFIYVNDYSVKQENSLMKTKVLRT